MLPLYSHTLTFPPIRLHLSIGLGVPLYNVRPCCPLHLDKLCIYTTFLKLAGGKRGNRLGTNTMNQSHLVQMELE